MNMTDYTEKNMLIEDAKVMSKGQITVPKKIRDYLNLDIGDRVILVADEEDRVIMMKASAAIRHTIS